jgi:hypothetical protein
MTKKAQIIMDKIAEETYMGSRAYDTAANISSLGLHGWMQNRALKGRAASGKGLITSEEKAIAPRIKDLAGEHTYPVSRAFTNPVGMGAVTAVENATLYKTMYKAPTALALGMGAATGLYTGGMAAAGRKMHSRALLGRAASGVEGTGQKEKEIIKRLK